MGNDRKTKQLKELARRFANRPSDFERASRQYRLQRWSDSLKPAHHQ